MGGWEDGEDELRTSCFPLIQMTVYVFMINDCEGPHCMDVCVCVCVCVSEHMVCVTADNSKDEINTYFSVIHQFENRNVLKVYSSI